MVTRVYNKRKAVPGLAAITLLLGLSGIGSAQAVTVFSENFEGYTSFPDEVPDNDPVNKGIPKKSEGAAEVWYGARIENGGGTINSDLAVQQYGGGSNNTHTGRVEDDVGLLFKINTTGLSSVNLSFDWRTFLTSTNDRVVVGYHVGSIAGFGACTGNGEAGCFNTVEPFASNSSLKWYTSQTSTTLSGNWSQLMRDGQSSAWQSESFMLPNTVANQSEVWFAFWLDNGEGDYAKFDNIKVTAVPEANTWAMMVAGLSLIGLFIGRRKQD